MISIVTESRSGGPANSSRLMLTVVGAGAGDRTQTRDQPRPFLLARLATQLTLAVPPLAEE